MDGGIRTSTPCRTPLPHELPDREIRRASDPVRTQDPDFNSLKRYHSLNAVKPLATQSSMKSLQAKSIGQRGAGTDVSGSKTGRELQGSNATFQSSRSSIATDAGRGMGNGETGDEDSNKRGKDGPLTDAELEVKMLEESEDMIIPDEMRRFLYEEGFSKGGTDGEGVGPVPVSSGEDRNNSMCNGRSNQRDPLEEIADNLCEDVPDTGVEAGRGDQRQGVSRQNGVGSIRTEMLAGNLTVQTGFGDLQNSGAISVDAGGGGSAGGSIQMDNFLASPTNRANFSAPTKPLSASNRPPAPPSPPASWHMLTDESCDEASPRKSSTAKNSEKSKTPQQQQTCAQAASPNNSYFPNTQRPSPAVPDSKSQITPVASPPVKTSAGTGALIPPGCVKIQADEVPLSTCRQQGTQQCLNNQGSPAIAGVSQGTGAVSNMNIAAAQQPGSHPASRHGSWDINSGSSGPPCTAYLSEQNLMQHQLQQHHQFHQHQQQQAAMAAAAAVAAANAQQFDPSFPSASQQVPPSHPMPHPSTSGPHQSNMHPHYYHQYPSHGVAGAPPTMGTVPPSILGGFSPVPPPGEKPPGHNPHHHQHRQLQKRASPQVQVPHISQSQIPANAKAASRNQAMLKQQQQQQHNQSQQQQPQPNAPPNRSPLVSPYHHPHHPQTTPYPSENCYPGSTTSSASLMPPPPNPQHGVAYPPYPYSYPSSVYPSSHQPSVPHPHPHMPHHHHHHHPQPQYPPMSPAGSAMSGQELSGIPGHHHPSYPPSHPNHLHAAQQPQMCGPTGDAQYPPHPGMSLSQPAQPGQPAVPGLAQPYPARSGSNSFSNTHHHPMEMSPGCNQVTSSTDRKETTAAPIEDFMDNLTSISAENIMDNIHSISQDELNYCGMGAGLEANPVHFTPNTAHSNLNPASSHVSMRTESQNSGRSFGNAALLNTSNMVVNDMSSVLTQLAEENKFLNMRP